MCRCRLRALYHCSTKKKTVASLGILSGSLLGSSFLAFSFYFLLFSTSFTSSFCSCAGLTEPPPILLTFLFPFSITSPLLNNYILVCATTPTLHPWGQRNGIPPLYDSRVYGLMRLLGMFPILQILILLLPSHVFPSTYLSSPLVYHLKFGLPDLPLRIRPVSMGTCTHNHCSFSPFNPPSSPVSHFGSSGCYLPSLPSCFQGTVGHFGPLPWPPSPSIRSIPPSFLSPLLTFPPFYPFRLPHFTLSPPLYPLHSPGYSLSWLPLVLNFHLRLLHHGAAGSTIGSSTSFSLCHCRLRPNRRALTLAASW